MPSLTAIPGQSTYIIFLMVCLVCTALAYTQGTNDSDPVRRVEQHIKAGRYQEALTQLNDLIAQQPRQANLVLLRAQVRETLGQLQPALEDYSRALAIDPALSEAYDGRGSVYFKLGKIDQSLADFDKYLQARPDQMASHWRRGITCYYAGKYAEGAKQFEMYQTVDSNDVENAVWHFLCVVRRDGLEAAKRQGLLPIGNDPRVPMMVVYRLFRDEAKPDDVLAACDTGSPDAAALKKRRFYAHLYLGLYYEAYNQEQKSLDHIKLAAKDYAVPGYMADVARVHFQLRSRR
jgi:lipoprotein NlpI